MSDLAGLDFARQSWGSSLGEVSFLPIAILTENSVSLDERFLLLSVVDHST